MAREVLLPKLGLTMQEGTIVEWVARPGDTVREGDVLLRMATDKVDVDVEAEGSGVFRPVAVEGATVPAGARIAWLLAEGEPVPGQVEAPPGAPAGEAPPAAEDVGELSLAAPAAASGSTRLRASPNARRIARVHGVDLHAVAGTGPGGRIVSEDVEELLARPAAPAPRASEPGRVVSPLVRREAASSGVDVSRLVGSGAGGRVRRADLAAAAPPPATAGVIPLTGMRGAIARAMHSSLQEMAQLTHGYEAEVGGLVRLREQLKAEWAGQRVPSINDFVVRAAALALREHPLLNATVRDDAVHLLTDVHVGVAVAVPDGLVVPVVRDAADTPLPALSAETSALAAAAREGRLSSRQLEGATFVVTSLGHYGVDFFTPVVNPGNVAILGVGRVKDGVRWEDETPVRTSVLTLSLSFDHRAVDGAPAADFLRTVSGLLATPLRLLAGP
ncbi:MAG: Dihydrolipoamide acetyltransferase component of pyruvate dehydrogenase complex [uncultured Frankineae bacterium]|uniref:Dihydrolipoamide acetyltransferase component of pyruvate dehydrogenase complex n=1 Tax=uncultured Frankineae bacterium TaxID=437475 RepID=A0A6J4KKV5_9ACTN|nr:MAG: Dihydrolipoamide acetyltransferase component of pyruvate dehydrogenase complex [uncultured Frankineae bacterium]